MSSDPSPRVLYLHGFASGPRSHKGVAVAEHYASRGVSVERLNLRVPSFERQLTSRMVDVTIDALGGPADRAVVFGSSLGGLTAARAAARDPRIFALVLLAPAFDITRRWKEKLDPEALAAWRDTGWQEVDDYAEKKKARIHYEFLTDLERMEAEGHDRPDVRVPTLIIHGTKDDVVPIDGTRAWAKGKRHVRVVEVEDGHELAKSLPVILAEADRHLSTTFG